MGLSKLLWLVVVAFFLVSAPIDTPDGAINAFISAINEGSFSKAAVHVVGGKPSTNFTQTKLILDGIKLSISDLKLDTNGDKCKATYRVRMELPNRPANVQSERIDLVRVDGDWLLVPAGQTSMSNEVLPSIAMLTVTDMGGVFANAKKAAQKTACLTNIKQLGTAVLIYLADHDDKFSMNPAKLKAALNPYTKNDRLWTCPLTPTAGAAYSLNAKLLKKNHIDIDEPHYTVMIYEGSKGKLEFKHAGYAAVAFADGSAKMVNAEMAKKLRWNP